MRVTVLFAFFSLAFLFLSMPLYAEYPTYEKRFFRQTLDHFNFNPPSYQTFEQTYLINSTYWGGPKNNSPIFVYMGNEGEIEWLARNTGFLFEAAPIFHALVVFIEHRFYGKSIPFGGNKSVALANSTTLGYLSSTQALADYATLILDLQKNLSAEDSPVVVFGGSYGGMLAAWFRLKYPHVAIGALASSAPILNFYKIGSPYTFYDIVTKDFKSESEYCYKFIKGSWEQLLTAAVVPGGEQLLRKSFKICKNSTVSSIAGWLMNAFSRTAMTDYPTPSNFLNPLPAYPVQEMCKAIEDPSTGNSTFAKLYKAANIYYNYTGTVPCFDVDADALFSEEWQWQSCTEMVMPIQGMTEDSLFLAKNYSHKDQASQCKSIYGVNPRPNWIATEFGGHDIRRVLKRFGSNIIFFNGLRDPWSGGGVTKSISKSIIAIVAKEGAHHVDLRFSTRKDPDWLKHVRKREIDVIGKWISQYYEELAESSS